MTKVFIASVALLLCGFPFAVSQNQKQEPSVPIPIRPLRPAPCANCPRSSFASSSGLSKPQQVVIRNLRAWKSMWRRIQQGVSPMPPLPKIDFSREMIVVVALGTRSSGGYGIVIERAVDKNGQLEIQVTKQSPGKNCFTTQALTQPVDVVGVPRTSRRVVFKETDVVQDCK